MLRRRPYDAAVRMFLNRLSKGDRVSKPRRLFEDSRMCCDTDDACEHLFGNRESRLCVHQFQSADLSRQARVSIVTAEPRGTISAPRCGVLSCTLDGDLGQYGC
jgi:hypothetical protein